MKIATLPATRVRPEVREAAEAVLKEGETLSSFIETAVRETAERRRVQAEFIARGLAASAQAKRTGVYIPAEEVFAKLEVRIEARRQELMKKTGKRAA